MPVSISKLKEPKPLKEVELQKACWQMLKRMPIGDKFLADWSYHVPNGMLIAGDRRVRAIRMAMLKSQGFKNGVSDIVIAYPTWSLGTTWHGAYFELKMRGNYPTQNQKEWLERMAKADYFTAVVRGVEEFRAQVMSFLGGGDPLEFTGQGKRK